MSTKVKTAPVVGVIGAGHWGTALAQTFVRAGYTVKIWDEDSKVLADIEKKHQNRKFFPGITLAEEIEPVKYLADVVSQCPVLVVAVPAEANTLIATELSAQLTPDHIVVIGSKGFRQSDGAMLSTVWQEAAPQLRHIAVLGGPTFALELLEEKITALVVAAKQPKTLKAVAELFATPAVRIYTSKDVTGVQVGGAVNNAMVIAAGMVDGMELGHNARAAVLTRGLGECARYAKAIGADTQTLYGLSGMGDMILNATSSMSRNYRFGKMVGEGVSPDKAQAKVGTVEGVHIVRLMAYQAISYGLDLAIITAVDGVLQGDVPASKVAKYLMDRPQMAEFEE